MMKVISTIIFLLLAGSCANKEIRNDAVIQKDKMIRILKELHLAEAYVNANFSYSDSARYLYRYMEDSILKAQGTSEVQFDSSMRYYRKNLKMMDGIYASTIDSLSLQEGLAK